MIIEIKREDSPEEIKKKLAYLSTKQSVDRKNRLSKLFGVLKLNEDPVKLQRKWRDEW